MFRGQEGRDLQLDLKGRKTRGRKRRGGRRA